MILTEISLIKTEKKHKLLQSISSEKSFKPKNLYWNLTNHVKLHVLTAFIEKLF